MVENVGCDEQNEFEEYGNEPRNVVGIPNWKFGLREGESLDSEDKGRRKDINLQECYYEPSDGTIDSGPPSQ